jgi:hypothetical protein
MVTCYVDTSAMLKRYVRETGSAWLENVLSSGPVVAMSTQLLVAEVTSAFNRRVREGTVTRQDYERLASRFRTDCRTRYQLLGVNTTILRLACTLLERHPLRAYDALHLASALTANQRLVSAHTTPLTFLCADDRLISAAGVEGLTAENPNDHA